jgi:arylformamidase
MTLFRGMDRAALDAAYNNTAAVGQAKRDAYMVERDRRTAAIGPSLKGKRDLKYGTGARERIDFFTCGKPNAPTLAFIHGGYWQMNDKEPYGYLGEGLLPAGFNLALIEYTLAPTARMDQIVAEIRRAVAWLIDHSAELGGDPKRLYVSGHSAGGHLTAAAMTETRVAGGIAISGIYNLEPIRLNYLNDKLGLDDAEAARNSPIRHLPASSAPLVVTVGLGELPELVRQSADFAKAWTAKGLPGRYLPLEVHDHFSILDELSNANGRLLAALKDMDRSRA